MELNGQSCLGLSSRKRLKKQSFRGVGSQIASDTVKLFPIGISGVNGELHSASPFAFSPFHGRTPDSDRCRITHCGFPQDWRDRAPLGSHQEGTLAVSLLDFDLTALDQYESPRPNEPEDEAFAMTDFDYYEHCMVHGFDGRNPDDVLDAQIELDFLREEVAGMRRAGLLPPESPDHLDPLRQAEVCEDVNFVTDNCDQFVARKDTTKKSKKFSAWQASLHGHSMVKTGNADKFCLEPSPSFLIDHHTARHG